ncbi:carbonic anhydrase [Bacillus sp. MRMR6]|uniref:carbonic anhydrase n=1 Tax=Bacillus sp. MRMR6 TaxID=1928617 RepID=UPI000951BE86|nr:carbonic anhydrase [Bacillus sp. MRMR6]OLS33824.1 carbonic anhydrase [Bacillus sp. MRMR6]
MKTKNKLMIGLIASSIAGRAIEVLKKKDNVSPNTETSFNLNQDTPVIDKTSYIHHFASVIGSVSINKECFIGPFASIRGDEGLKIYIGDYSNIQDGVVIHGMKNFEFGSNVVMNSVFKNNAPFSVYISDRCTLAPQSQINGPARIDSNVFIGTQCLILDAYVKENVVIEPGAKVMGVTIPQNRYVQAGRVITKQEDADQLPSISEGYRYFNVNKRIVSANRELALGYKGDHK